MPTAGYASRESFCLHAAPRLRLLLGQCRAPADPGLARPSSNPTHRALYGVKPDAVQRSVALTANHSIIRWRGRLVIKIVFPSGTRLHGPPCTKAEEDDKLVGRGPVTVARPVGDHTKTPLCDSH